MLMKGAWRRSRVKTKSIGLLERSMEKITRQNQIHRLTSNGGLGITVGSHNDGAKMVVVLWLDVMILAYENCKTKYKTFLVAA